MSNIKPDISIGIPFDTGYYAGTLCSSVGDTLGLTPIIEKLSKENEQQITVCTALPELFYNNPYVKEINGNLKPTVRIEPCRYVACNIVQFYASQANIELSGDTKPKIYLTDAEIEYGKNILKEYEGSKKIVVSTETYFDSKNLRKEFISPLFDRLRKQGYKLIGVGINAKGYYNYDKSFINKTTLREVCSIINASDLFIGIDNGLFHCAAALDVPQVVFFRNNLSSNNKYSNTYFIDGKVKCQGTCLNHIQVCQALMRCMDSFDLGKYYDLIEEQLNS